MKRRYLKRLLGVLLSLALLLGTAVIAGAEDGTAESVTYDFDSGLQGWTTLDADEDGHNWVAVSQFKSLYWYYEDLDLSEWIRGGQGDSIVSGSYYNAVGPTYPDNYLISPKVTLGGSFSFYAYSVDSYYEKVGVFVSTAGTAASDFEEVESWIVDGYKTWTEYTVDLSDYEGEGYVAIRNYDSYDQYLVVIDDVTITAPSGPKPHEHAFAFTADGDTITAVCTADGCDLEEDVTLQIVAPEKKVCDDELSPLATLSGLDSFNEITGLQLSADDIRYFDLTVRAETELEEAPTGAGRYEARITVGEGEDAATAAVSYEIAKAEPELGPPEGKELTYNGEDQELITAGESEDGTFEYALGTADEPPAEEDFGSELPVGKGAGTYYVYYRFIPDQEHEDAEPAEPIEVTIAPAVLTVTAEDQEKDQGDEDPELTYTAEGLFDGDELTGELAREEGEEPGEYEITIGTLDAGPNYTIRFTGARLVINEPVSENVDISGEIIWKDEDDKDGIRPDSVTVNLLADGEKVDSATVTAKDGWKFTFEQMPALKDSKEIVYTVTEEKVEGYECSVDGFTITNTHTPAPEPEPAPVPDTGDTTNIRLYAGLMAGSAVLLVMTAVFGRKRRDSE